MSLPPSEPVFHPTSFSRNRQRLLTTAVAEAFFAAIRAQADAHELLSREHFCADGTLIEVAAALWEPAAHRRGRRRGSPRDVKALILQVHAQEDALPGEEDDRGSGGGRDRPRRN